MYAGIEPSLNDLEHLEGWFMDMESGGRLGGQCS